MYAKHVDGVVIGKLSHCQLLGDNGLGKEAH